MGFPAIKFYRPLPDERVMATTDRDVALLQIELASVIGADAGYLSADDTHRHFDAATLVASYGASLFIIFVTAAGGRLRDHLEGTVKKGGVTVADAIWNRLKKIVGLKTSKEADTSKELLVAAVNVEGFSGELTPTQLDVFLKGGRDAVRERLLKDHFPSKVAEEKADRIAQVVKSRT